MTQKDPAEEYAAKFAKRFFYMFVGGVALFCAYVIKFVL
jgi:hypothetical protein